MTDFGHFYWYQLDFLKVKIAKFSVLSKTSRYQLKRIWYMIKSELESGSKTISEPLSPFRCGSWFWSRIISPDGSRSRSGTIYFMAWMGQTIEKDEFKKITQSKHHPVLGENCCILAWQPLDGSVCTNPFLPTGRWHLLEDSPSLVCPFLWIWKTLVSFLV